MDPTTKHFKVNHMIAELHSLEIESSLPDDAISKRISSPESEIQHDEFLPNIDDVHFIDRELSQFDNEFLEDFSSIAADEPRTTVAGASTLPVQDNSDVSLQNSLLTSNSSVEKTRKLADEKLLQQPLHSSNHLGHADEQPTATLSSDTSLADRLEKETHLISRLIDVQPCQRINTSIHNVNRIQPDFGQITAITSCPECIAVGSSGGYILVFDNYTGKVIARFDRSDALGAVSALDLNPRGTRALCGYSRGHVALIDLQKCYQRNGADRGPLVAGGAGEFLKTVPVASPLPSPILQLRFCSSLSGNPNDDAHITCICIESGGSVFRLRFRRLLNIITCDTDCIFSGARGEAFLIEPFVASAPFMMPEQHPLRSSQLVAVGTLNKVLLLSLSENTIDVFLNIPLGTYGNGTPDGSVVPDDSSIAASSSRHHRSSSANTLLSSGSFGHLAEQQHSIDLHATSIGRHRTSNISNGGDGRQLPCASWAFASVQPASSNSTSICRDPVLAVTCGRNLMLFHVYRDPRTRVPAGRLIKSMNFDCMNVTGRQLPPITSIVSVKWMTTVSLLLFDTSGLILLYDLKSNRVVDFIVPSKSSSRADCDDEEENADLLSIASNSIVHSTRSSRSNSTIFEQQQSVHGSEKSLVLPKNVDERQNFIGRLFSNRAAYAGGEADSLVSEAMAHAGECAAYTSVSATITARPFSVSSEREKNKTRNNKNVQAEINDAENSAQQRVFCLFDNNTLSCLRLRTSKERLDELEQHSRYADALEFALRLYKSKHDAATLVMPVAAAKDAAKRRNSTTPANSSEISSPHLRSDLHRLLLNVASQIVTHNTIFNDSVRKLEDSDDSIEKLLRKRDVVAHQLQRAVRLCFAALSLLCDADLLTDFYNLLSFQSQSCADDEDQFSSIENHQFAMHITVKRILRQSVSPENEFFIHLPSLLRKNDQVYEAQMPDFMKKFIKIVDTTCDKRASDEIDAVEACKSTFSAAESVGRVARQMRRRLLQTFSQLTLEANVRWFDVDAALRIARRLHQTHTIMRMSIDVKNDFISPLSEFVDAMRGFSANSANHEEKSMLYIDSNAALQHVGNNLIFYLSENLKGRRCVATKNGQNGALIEDAQLRRRVQESTWHWLLKRQQQNSSEFSQPSAETDSNLKFLLHANAKDLLNALQMCYADECFREAITAEQRNRFVSLLIKIMLIDNNNAEHSDSENAENFLVDDYSKTKTKKIRRKTLPSFTPSQVANLFTFVARLIAAGSSSAMTNESTSEVVNVNRALLEQILHHLCQNTFKNAESDSSDERELALIELFDAGALQCMNEALIIEKAKKAQFVTLIKLIYSRNARFDELFLALLDCIVAKKRRVADSDEVAELFTAARKVLVNDEAVANTTHAIDAERRVAVALLEHVVLLTQLDAEQTSFLVLQYFIKQRVAVEMISDSAQRDKKLILLPQNTKQINSRQRCLSEDEVLLSILRIFDATNRDLVCGSNHSDFDAGIQRAKFGFIMCFWKRGLLPLNYSATAQEMSANSYGGGSSYWSNVDSNAQQASARICWLLIDWTCQELEKVKQQDDQQEEEDDLTNILLNILRSFYFTTMPSTAVDTPPVFAQLLPNEEARRICRKHSIALAEAYLYELDEKFVDAYRILFYEQFCMALKSFCELVADQNTEPESSRLLIFSQFSGLMSVFEVLLEFCQRVNNRVPAGDHVATPNLTNGETDAEAEPKSAADANFTRQQMWLNIFRQFMTLMKHVETLEHSESSFSEVVERAGDALQRLLAAMIVYHVDMLHVLKQLVMSSSSAANTMLVAPKNRFSPHSAMLTTEQSPRIRLILDNIIASYEYQCTLYESVTTLLQNGVYSSLAHYLRAMRKRGIRVAGFRAASSSTHQQHSSVMQYHKNADGGFFYNKLWRNATTPAGGGGVCCICNKSIASVVEFGRHLRNSLSSRQNFSLSSRQTGSENDDVAVLHSGVGNRLVHLQCMLEQQQKRRHMHNNNESDDDNSNSTAAASSAAAEAEVDNKIPVNSTDPFLNDVSWSLK